MPQYLWHFAGPNIGVISVKNY